jgi:hypothetical protein
MPWRWKWLGYVAKLTHVMEELNICDTWHGVMWLGGEDQDESWLDELVARVKGKLEASFEAINYVAWKLEQWLGAMDQGNGEEQVRSRLMNQWGHVMIWSGSYYLLIKVGACVVSTLLEEMEWNAQGKCITYRAFHFIGHRCVEKLWLGLE